MGPIHLVGGPLPIYYVKQPTSAEDPPLSLCCYRYAPYISIWPFLVVPYIDICGGKPGCQLYISIWGLAPIHHIDLVGVGQNSIDPPERTAEATARGQPLSSLDMGDPTVFVRTPPSL